MAITPRSIGAGDLTRVAPAAPARMMPGNVDPAAAMRQAAALQRGGASNFLGQGMAPRRPNPLAQVLQQAAMKAPARPVARRPAPMAPQPSPFTVPKAIDRYVQAHAAHKQRQASGDKLGQSVAAGHDALVHHLEQRLRRGAPQDAATIATAARHPIGRQLLAEAHRNVLGGGAKPRRRR